MLSFRNIVFAGMGIALAAVTAAASPGVASAGAPDIEITGVIYGGNGCPQGTASVILSDDKTQFTVLFDDYIAETEERDWRVRRSCNLAVSLSIPAGYSVALLKLDYRGYARIPYRGFGQLRAEYFFAGDRGPVYTREFPRGHDKNYVFTDYVVGKTYSRCGDDVIARANTSVRAEKESRHSKDEAIVTVDTVDLMAGIIFYIDWRAC